MLVVPTFCIMINNFEVAFVEFSLDFISFSIWNLWKLPSSQG